MDEPFCHVLGDFVSGFVLVQIPVQGFDTHIAAVGHQFGDADKYILEGICCKFQAGESYCIVGLNGAGKTTIIKLLTKLYAPSKGLIMVDGVDLQDISSETYFRNIGVIFQDYIKYPLSVSDNIGVGKIEEIDNKDLIEKSAKLTKAEEFILTLPGTYDAILQKEWSDGIELSLGQWQKIAISRAYMSESSIVILDEPTASLDVESEAEVYKQFASLMKEKMCVLVSHRSKIICNHFCQRNLHSGILVCQRILITKTFNCILYTNF